MFSWRWYQLTNELLGKVFIIIMKNLYYIIMHCNALIHCEMHLLIYPKQHSGIVYHTKIKARKNLKPHFPSQSILLEIRRFKCFLLPSLMPPFPPKHSSTQPSNICWILAITSEVNCRQNQAELFHVLFFSLQCLKRHKNSPNYRTIYIYKAKVLGCLYEQINLHLF